MNLYFNNKVLRTFGSKCLKLKCQQHQIYNKLANKLIPPHFSVKVHKFWLFYTYKKTKF